MAENIKEDPDISSNNQNEAYLGPLEEFNGKPKDNDKDMKSSIKNK